MNKNLEATINYLKNLREYGYADIPIEDVSGIIDLKYLVDEAAPVIYSDLLNNLPEKGV